MARLAAAALPAGSRVLVVGAAAVRDALRRHRLVPVRRYADRPAAVVQALAPELTWRELEEATYAVAGGAAWFATHDDPVVPRAGGLAPGPGPLIDAIRTVTGR